MNETERPRVVVTGSQQFADLPLLRKWMDLMTAKLKNPIILTPVSYLYGPPVFRAKGADYLAEQWAMSRMKTVMRFHPDYDEYPGKGGTTKAHLARIEEMLDFAKERMPAYLLAFWCDGSKGEEASRIVSLAKKYRFKIKEVYEDD